MDEAEGQQVGPQPESPTVVHQIRPGFPALGYRFWHGHQTFGTVEENIFINRRQQNGISTVLKFDSSGSIRLLVDAATCGWCPQDSHIRLILARVKTNLNNADICMQGTRLCARHTYIKCTFIHGILNSLDCVLIINIFRNAQTPYPESRSLR